MKRSKSENDIKGMIHHNIDTYRNISENMREINGVVTEIQHIEFEIQELSKKISDVNDELRSDLVYLLLERDINEEMLECVNTQLEYNLSIL
jgi:hypothetical protein